MGGRENVPGVIAAGFMGHYLKDDLAAILFGLTIFFFLSADFFTVGGVGHWPPPDRA